jgi:gas vesicle protein
LSNIEKYNNEGYDICIENAADKSKDIHFTMPQDEHAMSNLRKLEALGFETNAATWSGSSVDLTLRAPVPLDNDEKREFKQVMLATLAKQDQALADTLKPAEHDRAYLAGTNRHFIDLEKEKEAPRRTTTIILDTSDGKAMEHLAKLEATGFEPSLVATAGDQKLAVEFQFPEGTRATEELDKTLLKKIEEYNPELKGKIELAPVQTMDRGEQSNEIVEAWRRQKAEKAKKQDMPKGPSMLEKLATRFKDGVEHVQNMIKDGVEHVKDGIKHVQNKIKDGAERLQHRLSSLVPGRSRNAEANVNIPVLVLKLDKSVEFSKGKEVMAEMAKEKNKALGLSFTRPTLVKSPARKSIQTPRVGHEVRRIVDTAMEVGRD